ncbi:MAG: bifunctional 4-hydroxy-2-oxoglutarate aldolase/2-dehydro-3-deoxy-phosphogluconate aldolase [Candidatus Omnitrophota bacterium]
MDIAKFKKLPIMGILRGVKKSEISPLIETIIASGMETVEITMNTEDAPELIKEAKKVAGDRLMIGAGTVLSMYALHAALEAGATFIVMPGLVEDVTEYCVKNYIPVFPGALTPDEVLKAWQSGATMVKIFPSGLFGPQYFRELKGPLNEVQLMAVGGVRQDNIWEFFSCGASAVGIGGSVFNRQQIVSGNHEVIKASLMALVSAIKQQLRR